ncbi:hypothetical protein B0H15DRAFT_800058 [Mycena belliarum]|uniref:Uncharacterized protein n=1 Tax=Mycena belliarum TaxID=1033014 RepID=A0AAD6UAI9_9AGAR|nr:hypothetical protein B0H15DRAFT_800058 [Mycena belliae]
MVGWLEALWTLNRMLRLLRGLMDLWASMIEKLAGLASQREEPIQEGRTYKGQGSGHREASLHHPAALLRMNNLAELPPSHALPHVGTAELHAADCVPPLSLTQYLSRRAFNEPPATALTLDTANPIAAIDGGALRVWLQHEEDRAPEIAPTFAAAPHSEYFGSEVLPDGQRVHHHAAYNVLRVLKNMENKQAFTIAGHEFVTTLEVPPPGVVWSREVPYPTDEELRREMMRLTPNDPPADGCSGFPTHATKEAPPMPTLKERLDAQQVRVVKHKPSSRTNCWGVQKSRWGERPAQDDAGSQTSYDSLPELVTRSPSPTSERSSPAEDSCGSPPRLPTTRQIYDASAQVEALTRDIEQRAMKVLRLDGSEEARHDTKGEQATESGLGICTMCLGPEHELAKCPQILADSGASLSLASLTGGGPSMFYFLDELLLDPELIPPAVVAQQRPEVQQFLRTALAPTLDALVSLPSSEAGRYAELMRVALQFQTTYHDLEAKLDEVQRGASRLASRELMRDLEEAAIIFREAGGHVDADARTASAAVRKSDSTSACAQLGVSTASTALTQAALATHTERLATPVFDFVYGHPVDRDNWTSSTSSVSTPSEVEISLYDPFQRPAESSGERSSPDTTEWVLDQRSDSDRGSEPPRSITDASEASDSNSLEDLGARSNQNGTLRGQHRDVTEAERDAILAQWIEDGHDHMDKHVAEEDWVCGGPLRFVLAVLHERLGEFLDYPAMEADGLARLSALADAASEEESVAGNDEEIRALPLFQASAIESAMSEDREAALKQRKACRKSSMRTDRPGAMDDPEPDADTGSKRKAPSDEQQGQYQEGPRKRPRKFHGDSLRKVIVNREARKAAGLLDENHVRLFAGVRLGLKEAGRRLEDLAWHKYGISKVWEWLPDIETARANSRSSNGLQRHFPDEFLRHPLLFDTECAKLQAIHEAFHERGRYVLSTLLYDALTLRFKDEYATSHLLNAGYLDSRYPADQFTYYQLLPPPRRANYYTYTSEDDTSSSSSDWNPYDFDLQYPDDASENEPPVVVSLGQITIAIDNSEASDPAPPYDDPSIGTAPAARTSPVSPTGGDTETNIEVADDARFNVGDISVATRNAPFPGARLAALNETSADAHRQHESSDGSRPVLAIRPIGGWDRSGASFDDHGEIGIAF